MRISRKTGRVRATAVVSSFYLRWRGTAPFALLTHRAGIWLVRRALHAALMLFAVSVLSFLMARLAPGSFFDGLALDPQVSPQTISRLRDRYGIDRPFAKRYIAWISSAVKGDLGSSVAYQQPVARILLPRAASTLKLTSASLALTWSIALPLALLAAVKPHTVFAWIGDSASSVLLAIPELLLALASLYMAVHFGYGSAIGGLGLPLAVLTAGAFPLVFRHCHAALEEHAGASYIAAARAHGIKGARLWLRFILPSAANPLISLFGVTIGGLVGSSLIVEVVFSRPGIAPLFLEAISARDLDIVTAVMLLSAFFVVAGNFLSDMLLAICDPRIQKAGW